MTLEEVRAGIDAVDTQMKPLFLKRMECGKHVAEVKAQTGGDVFVLERELEIIEKRATDVDPEIQEEYKTFLRHLMSLCRKYEYELLPEMQEKVMTAALAAAGLTAETEHTQVKIGFTCPKETSDLNLFVNMTKLNGIQIDAMNLMTENGNSESNNDTGWKDYGCGNAVLVVSDRERGRGVPDFRIDFYLINYRGLSVHEKNLVLCLLLRFRDVRKSKDVQIS